ncbi:hypothetical protein AADZ90_013485 [Aestuariibius sp. 2305UL40-4]|uniref:hypothetical protein n=1 Tax=Aestuariibius violaceus TaxID=3234132 RepID=UPI00345E38C1
MAPITDIWAHPPSGQPPDLTAILAARSAAEAAERSEDLYAAAMAATERQMEADLTEARTMQAQLKQEGIDFDVDRMMAPSLTDRLLMRVDDLRDWIADRFQPDGDPSGDLAGAMAIPLGRTHPTNRLPQDYEAIFAEIQRFRDAIAAQITRSRGAPPQGITIPDAALDFVEYDDTWTEEQALLDHLSDYCAYWPPSDHGPALALTERQEDGGLPIEIELIVHGPSDHARIIALLKAHGAL